MLHFLGHFLRRRAEKKDVIDTQRPKYNNEKTRQAFSAPFALRARRRNERDRALLETNKRRAANSQSAPTQAQAIAGAHLAEPVLRTISVGDLGALGLRLPALVAGFRRLAARCACKASAVAIASAAASSRTALICSPDLVLPKVVAWIVSFCRFLCGHVSTKNITLVL